MSKPEKPDASAVGPAAALSLEQATLPLELLQEVDEGLLCLDLEHRVVYLNQVAADMLRRPAEQLLGRQVERALAPFQEPSFPEALRQALALGRPSQLEVNLQSLAGPLAGPLRLVLRLFPHREGAAILLRDSGEAPLSRLNRQRFLELSQDLLCVAGLDGHFRWLNSAFSRVLGHQRSELLSRPFLDLVHPEDQDSTRKAMDLLGKGQPVMHFVNRFRTHDGQWRWLSWCSNPSLEEGLVFAVARDVSDLVRAESRLRSAASELKLILDTVPASIWFKDRHNNILRANQACASLIGLPLEEIEGKNAAQLFPDWLAQKYLQDDLEVIESGRPKLGIEEQCPTADGQMRWVSTDKLPWRDEKGEIAGVLAFTVDITESKSQREAREESERRYRQLFQEMTSGLALHEIICDDRGRPEDYRFIAVNPAFEQLTGLERATILGRTVREFLPQLEEEWLQRYGRVALTGQPEQFENYNQDLEKHFEVKAFCPKPGQFAALFQDISERVQAREALRRQRDRLRAFMDVAGVMILALDHEGRVTLANRKCCQVLGYEEEQILGRDWFEHFLPARAREQAREIFNQLAEGGLHEQVCFENLVLTKSGGERVISWRNAYFQDEDGQRWGTLSSGEDVTDRRREERERQRLDAQIQHAQKLESLGVLAGGIAHDFNNLLVSMLGNAELALLDVPPESPVRGRLNDLRDIAIKASELSSQMLAYSGKGRFLVEALNINRLVDEMAHLLRVSIAKNVVLKYNFHPDLPLVQADPSQLRQVVMNLIINASESIGGRSGVVTLSTGVTQVDHRYLRETFVNDELPEGFYVYLEISDTGCGMDQTTRLRIFDPFFTTKFTGRGLGLSAVLGIVRGHRGAIKVYSEPNRGTSFKVLLPCAQEQSEIKEADSRGPVASPAEGGLVLVVDDEESVRTMTRMMLERSGYQVITAEDGRQGVELFEKQHDQLRAVILDMTMPHMNGEQAFGEMRRINNRVPVILASGYNEQDATNRFSGKGLAGFLQKPFRLKDLRDKMAQAMGKRQG